MSRKLQWEKAKPRRPTEFAIGEGVLLRNGASTPKLPKDSLALRAERAEKTWIEARIACGLAHPDEPEPTRSKRKRKKPRRRRAT